MILLENSVKYSGPNALVEVRLENDVPDFYSVVVRDTGPGIPEESRHAIFDRFFRVDPSRARTRGDANGAGLGLAIGKWIAEQHGGSLTLEGSSPKGSTFRARFRRQSLLSTQVVSANQPPASEHAGFESVDSVGGAPRA